MADDDNPQNSVSIPQAALDQLLQGWVQNRARLASMPLPAPPSAPGNGDLSALSNPPGGVPSAPPGGVDLSPFTQTPGAQRLLPNVQSAQQRDVPGYGQVLDVRGTGPQGGPSYFMKGLNGPQVAPQMQGQTGMPSQGQAAQELARHGLPVNQPAIANAQDQLQMRNLKVRQEQAQTQEAQTRAKLIEAEIPRVQAQEAYIQARTAIANNPATAAGNLTDKEQELWAKMTQAGVKLPTVRSPLLIKAQLEGQLAASGGNIDAAVNAMKTGRLGMVGQEAANRSMGTIAAKLQLYESNAMTAADLADQAIDSLGASNVVPWNRFSQAIQSQGASKELTDLRTKLDTLSTEFARFRNPTGTAPHESQVKEISSQYFYSANSPVNLHAAVRAVQMEVVSMANNAMARGPNAVAELLAQRDAVVNGRLVAAPLGVVQNPIDKKKYPIPTPEVVKALAESKDYNTFDTWYGPGTGEHVLGIEIPP